MIIPLTPFEYVIGLPLALLLAGLCIWLDNRKPRGGK